MLFNSYSFIFIFLIPLLIGAKYIKQKHILGFLILASVVFYAQWDLLHLSLLVTSIAINYFLAKYLSSKYKKSVLALAVTLNLIPLVFFKYSVFLSLSSHSYTLPLAISFYTFQQIAFLADVYRKKIKRVTLKDYLFFVLFFPQLIAGPIVHYNQLMPQVKNISVSMENILAGLVVFSIGLAKKVLLADSLSPIASQGFDLVQNGVIGSLDAWMALFAYSFEIYFDFSGYSDMAIGLALMFGILLPTNFNSPYKASNIIEFWRRWHITLSTFLKEHIYIPLGGNKNGVLVQLSSLFVTMLIGGMWHGSGYTFLLWGAAHGILLALTHVILLNWKRGFNPAYNGKVKTFLHFFGNEVSTSSISEAKASLPNNSSLGNEVSTSSMLKAKASLPIFKTLLLIFQVAVLFLSVTLLWVLFRSPSMEVAIKYYHILFALSIEHFNIINILVQKGIYYNLFTDNRLFMLTLSFAIVWLVPFNSNYFYDKKPTKVILFISALLFMISLKTMALAPSKSFLYFNF